MKFTQVFLIFAIIAAGALASSPSRERRQAVSECPTACTEELAPVCGSNGKCTRAFSNRCQLVIANCKLNRSDQYKQVGADRCNNFRDGVFDRCLKQLYKN